MAKNYLKQFSARNSLRRSQGLTTLGLPSLAQGLVAISASTATALLLVGSVSNPEVTNPENLSKGLLALLALVFLVLTQRSNAATNPLVPAANWLMLASISGAFALGLLGGDFRLDWVTAPVAQFLALGTVSIAVGTLAVAIAFKPSKPRFHTKSPSKEFRSSVLTLGAIVLFLAFLNVAMVGPALFSSNIDARRFSGTESPLSPLFPFLLGGVQWLMLLAICMKQFHKQEVPNYFWVIALSCAILFVLIAIRSMIVLVIVAALMALLAARRIPLRTILITGILGLLVLGIAGQFRSERSDPTGERSAYLLEHGYGRILGPIVQSAATGPYVLSRVLEQVPDGSEFQHGGFLTRDLGSQIPLHPFGYPQPSDGWVTSQIINKDTTTNGGSPPTLVGGFYIDFGVFGIVVGCLLLGATTLVLGRWSNRAGTISAFCLFGYLTSYIILATYSYISLKPASITVVVLLLVSHAWEKQESSNLGA